VGLPEIEGMLEKVGDCVGLGLLGVGLGESSSTVVGRGVGGRGRGKKGGLVGRDTIQLGLAVG